MKLTVIQNCYVKMKTQSVADKIIADFVLDLLTFTFMSYAITQHHVYRSVNVNDLWIMDLWKKQ